MENTAIRSPHSPASTNPVARNAGARQAAAADAVDARGGFSLLLADLGDMAEIGGTAAPDSTAVASELEDPLARAERPAEWLNEVGVLSLSSLVGQTARMDGAADAAQRDGRAGDGDGAGAGAWGQAALPMGGGRPAPTANLSAATAATGNAWGGAQLAVSEALNGAATDLSDTAAISTEPSTLSLNPSERGAQPHGLAALLARMEPEATPWASAPMPGLPVANSAAPAAGLADASMSATGAGATADATADAGAVDTAAVDTAAADAVLSSPDDAWADQLSEQVAFWVQQKTQRAEMTIDRQGRPVQVQVTITGNEAHVTFRSSEQQTRDMFDAGTAQLREMLEQQGLNLASVTVQTADAGGQGASSRQDPSGRSATAPDEDGQRQTVQVSVDLRARPDASRTVDLFV